MDRAYPHVPGTKGTDTSIAAAEAIEPVTARLQRLTLRAIRAAGDNGLTSEEVAAVLKVERVTAQPRTSELRAQRLIADSGQRRRNGSGKRAIVWVAAGRREDAA